jgi:hypothetical protein
MKRILTAMVGLALVATACGGDGDDAEAAPTVVIDGETAAADSDTTDSADSDSDESADSDSDTASADQTDEELALEFAQCMRDNGVDGFPDPAIDADGSIELIPGGPNGGAIDPDDPAIEGAAETCTPIIEGASFLPGADLDVAEVEDDLLAMAQCLRDLGNDIDDPDLAGGLPGPGQLQTIFGENFDPLDPANADDIETCQQEVFGPEGPPGFGGGN